MRIPSGTTDQYIYFVAVDATDLKTRETGLSSFTVYRSRDGAAAAAMTTPTINETDGTNMPGVYELLLDEDMSIAAGNDSEEMVFHITCSGMAPVTRVIELYRSKITVGNTLSVESDGDLTKVNTLEGHTAQTGDAYAVVNSGTFGNSALKTLIDDVPTNAELDSAVGNVSVDEIQATAIADLFNTDSGTTYASAVAGSAVKEIADNAGGSALTEAGIADAVWDELIAGHAGVGSTGASLAAAGGSGDPWATALPGSYGAGTAGKIIGDNINAAISSVITDTEDIQSKIGTPSGASISVDIAAVKSDSAAILVDTGTTLDTLIKDIPTVAEFELRTLPAADYTVVSDLGTVQTADHTSNIAAIKAKTDNLPSDPADQSAVEAAISALSIPTTSQIADAVMDEVLPDLSDNALNAGESMTSRKILRGLFNRFFRKVTQTASAQIVMNDSGTQIASMAVSDDGTTQTKDIAT